MLFIKVTNKEMNRVNEAMKKYSGHVGHTMNHLLINSVVVDAPKYIKVSTPFYKDGYSRSFKDFEVLIWKNQILAEQDCKNIDEMRNFLNE